MCVCLNVNRIMTLLSMFSCIQTILLPCVLYLKVARCTKIIDADSDHPKYVIHVKQFAKFVVNLHKNLAPTDVEEGMRVGLVSLLCLSLSVCVCIN